MKALWIGLFVLAAAEGVQGATEVGGEWASDLFQDWIHIGLIATAGGLCLARAAMSRRTWPAWVAFGLGLVVWAVGEAVWIALYSHDESLPAFSAADVFWLAWYPLVAVGLVLLVRDTVPGFELHRWIDGLAAALIVATAGVGLALHPVAEESEQSGLAKAIEFVYPLGDVILVGAVIGVFPLLAWRPARAWIVLGVGLAVITISDAIYAVKALEEEFEPGAIDFMWPLGALLIALAAWQPAVQRLPRSRLTGWAAIALPLACQALAIAINIYGYFNEIPESERILTVAVLMIAMIQIVVSRPRGASERRRERGFEAREGREPDCAASGVGG